MAKPTILLTLLAAVLASQLPVSFAQEPQAGEHSQGATQVQDNLPAIRANLDLWLAAFNAKDIDALMALYDPDSSYANANAPFIDDLPTIRARYSATFAGVNGTLLFKEEKAFAGTDMGLIVGKYYFAPPEGTDGDGPTGRVSLVYRKQADGTWKLLFDMDNTPPDISPADFE